MEPFIENIYQLLGQTASSFLQVNPIYSPTSVLKLLKLPFKIILLRQKKKKKKMWDWRRLENLQKKKITFQRLESIEISLRVK